MWTREDWIRLCCGGVGLTALIVLWLAMSGCAAHDFDRALDVAHKATRAVCAAKPIVERVIDSRRGGEPLTFSVGAPVEDTGTASISVGGVRIVVQVEPVTEAHPAQ